MLYEAIVLSDPPNAYNDMLHYMSQQKRLVCLSTKYDEMINIDAYHGLSI